MHPLLLLFFLLFLKPHLAQAQLKSIVYDFDGLDIGATDLPEGDYQSGYITASISANPLPPNDMIGDRCLHINLNPVAGNGVFGRGIARYIEFDVSKDEFHFYLYNPTINSQNIDVEILLYDDDDQNHVFDFAKDDVWSKTYSVPSGNNWTLYSTALKDFKDINSGGNNNMDMAFTNDAGMLLSVEFKFKTTVNYGADFFIDMLAFSEGSLPSGKNQLSLPEKENNDFCMLGAYSNETQDNYHLTPTKFEALFNQEQVRKIKYVNTFLHWAYGTSTVPSEMPGKSAQILLNNGYTPILTWEPMFAGFDRLDPIQPRLQNILNGEYDTYIDQFADEVKKLSDTIIIRFMHEFEGDWYAWSLCKNGNDPQKYQQAFRHVVNRFRNRGVNNVKWMWCLNSDYAPYAAYNFAIMAYPGDNYVDIVANDIYNNHFPVQRPWWRSFRWQMTESYYYLQKYIPNKPLFVCEVGCRERFTDENANSESKGEWYQRMDKELQSNFRKARALIFFNANPDQNWLVNSSSNALESIQQNIWSDDYYFKTTAKPVAGKAEEASREGFVFPNPFETTLYWGVLADDKLKKASIQIYNSLGMLLYQKSATTENKSYTDQVVTSYWSPGFYFLKITSQQANENDTDGKTYHYKLLKE